MGFQRGKWAGPSGRVEDAGRWRRQETSIDDDLAPVTRQLHARCIALPPLRPATARVANVSALAGSESLLVRRAAAGLRHSHRSFASRSMRCLRPRHSRAHRRKRTPLPRAPHLRALQPSCQGGVRQGTSCHLGLRRGRRGVSKRALGREVCNSIETVVVLLSQGARSSLRSRQPVPRQPELTRSCGDVKKDAF